MCPLLTVGRVASKIAIVLQPIYGTLQNHSQQMGPSGESPSAVLCKCTIIRQAAVTIHMVATLVGLFLGGLVRLMLEGHNGSICNVRILIEGHKSIIKGCEDTATQSTLLLRRSM